MSNLSRPLVLSLLAALLSAASLQATSPPPPPLTVAFEFASSWWTQDAGATTIRVQLSAASAQIVSVDFASSDGTATAPADYSATLGTVTFQPGETIKAIDPSLTIVINPNATGAKSCQLTLSNPVNATLGVPITHDVNIMPTTYTVAVAVTTEPLGPMAIFEQKQVALTADASLIISGTPPSGLAGPSWAWQVTLVEYSSDGISYVPSMGGDHVQLDHPDSTVADATLIASFDTAGYWKITVKATASYYVGAAPIASGDTDGTVLAMAADTFDFQSNGAIAIVAVPTTARTTGAGTSPADGSLVSPGQRVTFQLVLQDMDQVRVTGAAAWTDFGTAPNWPGQYSVSLTLTNARFTDSGLRTRTTNATRGGGGVGQAAILSLSNVPITVDAPWAGNVTIAIQVTDGITIPANIPLGPGIAATACQDAVWNGTITWRRATVFPLTETPDNQTPGGAAGLGVIQNTQQLTVWYLYGPDTNGAHTNYQGVSVDELFTARTSNITTAWVSAALRAAHPTWVDADWVTHFFSGTGTNNVTFAIGADDHTSDTHSNRAVIPGILANLSVAGRQATLFVDLPQTHETPPATVVGRYTIRRQRTGAADESGTYQLRKW